MRKSKLLVIAALFALAVSTLTSLQAGGFTQLPRSVGPFEIGMTQSEFKNLTGVSPASCPICIKNEFYASLNENDLKQLDIDADGADFFFYNNSLYHILIGPKDKDLFATQQDYESQFGGPADKSINKKGIGLLQWEDFGTVITLKFNDKEKKVYSVNFYDWNLKEERDWRESIANEQSNSSTATLD